MPIAEFRSLEDLRSRVGAELAVSDWLAVDQARIDAFAEATGDRQWIHVDPERAAKESPFGGTVAHGFLTLSLIPGLVASALVLPRAKLTVNYGLNRVRFAAPVLAGRRVRAHVSLLGLEDVEGGVQMTSKVVIEVEGSDKPACVAETVSRRYP